MSRVFQECLMKFCFAILFFTDLIAATRAEEGLVLWGVRVLLITPPFIFFMFLPRWQERLLLIKYSQYWMKFHWVGEIMNLAWYNISKSKLKLLVTVNVTFWRKFIDAPKSTNKEVLYLEMGCIPFKEDHYGMKVKISLLYKKQKIWMISSMIFLVLEGYLEGICICKEFCQAQFQLQFQSNLIELRYSYYQCQATHPTHPRYFQFTREAEIWYAS